MPRGPWLPFVRWLLTSIVFRVRKLAWPEYKDEDISVHICDDFELEKPPMVASR